LRCFCTTRQCSLYAYLLRCNSSYLPIPYESTKVAKSTKVADSQNHETHKWDKWVSWFWVSATFVLFATFVLSYGIFQSMRRNECECIHVYEHINKLTHICICIYVTKLTIKSQTTNSNSMENAINDKHHNNELQRTPVSRIPRTRTGVGGPPPTISVLLGSPVWHDNR
jgi:hypothetical protein